MPLLEDAKVMTITETNTTPATPLNAAGGGLAGIWILGSAGAADPGNVTVLGCPDHEDVDHTDPTAATAYVAHGAAIAGPVSWSAGNMFYLEFPVERFSAVHWFAIQVTTAPGASKTLTIYPNFL